MVLACRNFPVFSEVVKRRVLFCQAFFLNDTEVIERLIGNLRVGNHVLRWEGEKRCPVLWPLKSCSSSCSCAEGKPVQSISLFQMRN